MLDSAIKTQLKTYLERLQHPVELRASLDASSASDEVRALQRAVEDVYVDELLIDWIVDLVRATREVEGERLVHRLSRWEKIGALHGDVRVPRFR